MHDSTTVCRVLNFCWAGFPCNVYVLDNQVKDLSTKRDDSDILISDVNRAAAKTLSRCPMPTLACSKLVMNWLLTPQLLVGLLLHLSLLRSGLVTAASAPSCGSHFCRGIAAATLAALPQSSIPCGTLPQARHLDEGDQWTPDSICDALTCLHSWSFVTVLMYMVIAGNLQQKADTFPRICLPAELCPPLCPCLMSCLATQACMCTYLHDGALDHMPCLAADPAHECTI